MKRLLVVFCALPLFALSSAACSDSDTSTDPGGSRTDTIIGLSGDATAGGLDFGSSCALAGPCHNSDGTPGASSDAPDLTTETANLSDAAIVDVLLNGQGQMTPFNSKSDQELADLLAYLRSEWGG